MKEILDFLAKNQFDLKNLSSIFVNKGPGNFSSLRTSIAIAKGISISKNIKLYGYDTFIWSCASFYKKKKFICSIVKFNNKYFVKEFDNELNTIGEMKEITEASILEKYNNKIKVIPKNISSDFSEKVLKLKYLNIVDLDHNLLEFLKLKGLINESLIKPLYLN